MKEKKQSLIKRSIARVLIWPESPSSLLSSSLKAMFPAKTKATPEELAEFRKLTPEQRWRKIKKPDWTGEKIEQERNWSSLLSYIYFGCGLLIVVATSLAVKHLNGFQIAGALAYGGAAFLLFAKKSMWVYALDNRKVILFPEWLRMPGEWIP